jgi:hypothetical protein
MMDHNPELDQINMRNLGENLTDRGFFEINMVTGQILWVNDFCLTLLGYELEQIQCMSVYDIVLPEFREILRSSMYDRTKGKHFRHEILPIVDIKNDVIWWYVFEVKISQPLLWLRGEYLRRTPRVGSEASNMMLALNTVQAYNDLASKLEDHVSWDQKNFDELASTLKTHDSAIKDIREKLGGIHGMAERAANEAIAANTAISNFKTSMDDALANQTTEILRLIGSDVTNHKRLEVFEKNIQNIATTVTTTAATEITKHVEKAHTKIAEQSEKAGVIITKQAEEASKGISRRITIPMSLIIMLAAAAQLLIQLIQHWK